MSSLPENDDHGMLLVEAVEALKLSWNTGDSSIESIGSKLTGKTRIQALLQLVLIDCEFAIAAGKHCTPEHYIKHFPDLSAHRSSIEDHIAKIRSAQEDVEEVASPGLFSMASLGRTLEHAPNNDFDEAAQLEADEEHSEPDTVPPEIGSYRILRELGRGSFGKVLLAEDTRLQRKVAIKIQDGNNVDFGLSGAFLHEARAISRLDHPSIIRLLHVDETTDGVGYLVYEYVTGSTLAERVKLADYSIAQAVEWIVAIANALDYAHRHGVIHRDISPGNIMIDETGTARLLDFGLSRLDDRFYVPDEDRLLGTPNFMSPEQASGKPHWATSCADLFSLGSVLYYALTGKLPFQGKSVFDVCERIHASTPPPLRSIREGIPRELEAVVSKAMAKEPQSRYSTGADFAIALQEAIAPRPTETRPLPSDKLLRVILGSVALVMVCLGIGILNSAWHTYLASLPVPEITNAELYVERDDGKTDLLTEAGSKILPLQSDDKFTLGWTTSDRSGEATTSIILVIGVSDSNRRVIYPSTQSLLLQPTTLFPEPSLVLLCLSQQSITQEQFMKLPSPWVSSSAPSRASIFYMEYRTPELHKALTTISHLKQRSATLEETHPDTIELSEPFKAALIKLGVKSYFGVVLDRHSQPSPE